MMRSTILSTGIALCCLTSAAQANDSEMELALGGLTLKHSYAITMDSEDLYISQEEVRVTYRFTNTLAKDITTHVAFPLPDLPDGDSDKWMLDYREYLEFKTSLDGKPLDLDYAEQAILDGKDVSQALIGMGLILNGGDRTFSTRINAMPLEQRTTLVQTGFIREAGSDGNPIWEPLWKLRVTVTREQTFPAGKTVTVSHRYRPLAGGSVGGALEPDYRHESWHKEQVKKYCIEDSWFKAFDKRRAKTPGYSEVWLGYVLTSGANWKGPIKDFRMVIDKGKPGSLVSFCAEGVRKISPTQFEVRKKNYEPDRDINVLIINWAGE
jgi:hypothetical protein